MSWIATLPQKYMKLARPGLFLDRDGVINQDLGYVHRREDFKFIDGIFDLCREAQRLGYWIFVITNQAGIGRGYYSESEFLELTDWMKNYFRSEGIEITAVYFCPFHPQYGMGKYKRESNCRKPRPGMILQAVEEFGVDLSRSVLVGDKPTDVEAGNAAGIISKILFDQEAKHSAALSTDATVLVVNDLRKVPPILIRTIKHC